MADTRVALSAGPGPLLPKSDIAGQRTHSYYKKWTFFVIRRKKGRFYFDYLQFKGGQGGPTGLWLAEGRFIMFIIEMSKARSGMRLATGIIVLAAALGAVKLWTSGGPTGELLNFLARYVQRSDCQPVAV